MPLRHRQDGFCQYQLYDSKSRRSDNIFVGCVAWLGCFTVGPKAIVINGVKWGPYKWPKINGLTGVITLLIGSVETTHLGGGLKYLIHLYPDPWGDDPIWRAYFSNGSGLVQPPTTQQILFEIPKKSQQLVWFDTNLINVNGSDEKFPHEFGSVFEASQDDSLDKTHHLCWHGFMDCLGVAKTL